MSNIDTGEFIARSVCGDIIKYCVEGEEVTKEEYEKYLKEKGEGMSKNRRCKSCDQIYCVCGVGGIPIERE